MPNEQSRIVSGAAIVGGCGPGLLGGRSKLVLGVSAAAMMAAALAVAPRTSHAANECGLAAPGDTVECTSDGNDYPDGITYTVDDLTIILADGAVVESGTSSGISSSADGSLSVITEEGSEITTSGVFAAGIFAYSADGSVAIEHSGSISTNGWHGIDAQSLYGSIDIVNLGTISTTGNFLAAISVDATFSGAVDITNEGRISADNIGISVFTVGAGPVHITNNGEIESRLGIQVEAGEWEPESTVEILNSGIIRTVGDAIWVTAHDIDINNIGSISTSGDNATGIYATNYGWETTLGVIDIANSGDVSTEGINSDGIFATGGEIIVTNAGSVTTLGAYAVGISATTNNGPITITNSGSVTTSGADAEGIFATGSDHLIDITNSGAITTSGDGASGISTRAHDGSTMIYNSGIISTTGEPNPGTLVNPAHGIYAGSNAGSIIITNVDDVHTEGAAAIGLFASSTSGDVSIFNSGDITTTGDTFDFNGATYIASGIFAQTTGAIVITNSGEDGNPGTIETHGVAADGISVVNGSSVTITNSGDITTHGDHAEGIFASTNNGPITITNSGSVTTSGADAEGIFATGFDHLIDITNSGDITTSGNGSDGIFTRARDGSTTIYNSGIISTSGDPNPATFVSPALGIYAGSNAGSIDIRNVGEVQTGGSAAAGVFANSVDGDVTIYNSGVVRTSGGTFVHEGVTYNAAGIAARTTGAIVITNSGEEGNSGTVETHGIDADGIYARNGSSVTITNSGDVTTHGAGAEGIYASTNFGPITITNSNDTSGATATITTFGDDAEGIYASTFGGAIAITSQGDITTYGNGLSEGIFAETHDGAITIDSSGDITTHGVVSDGIGAYSDYGDVSIFNSGDITTHGSDANGISADTFGGITIQSSGNITTNGDGIAAEASDISIVNSGAINAGDDGIQALGGGAVTNHGSITAANDGIFVSGGTVTVTNTGQIAAGDDGIEAIGDDVTVINSGTIGTAAMPVGGMGILAEGLEVSVDNSDAIHSTGTGIHAEGDLIAISNAGTIGTLADGADGIAARGDLIAIASAGTIATDGDDAQGIDAWTAVGPITIDNQGDIGTIGAGSHGILAVKDGGDAPVANDIDVASSGDITTTGPGASGIVVSNDLGNFDVTVSGAVTTSGDDAPAIDAFTANGSGSVNTVAGVIGTSGDFSTGVLAGSGLGDVHVAVGNLTTQGAHAPGVHAFTGSGDAAVSVFGHVAASGPGSSGVIVDTPDGLQSVFVDADASITSGPDGSTPAAVLFEGTGMSWLVNHGLIQAANDLVVSSVSSISTTIDNFGTMIGNVILGDGPDTFNNHAGGLFQARGDSFFEGGFDQFINEGTVQVTDGPVTFHDLEVFDNSNGTITMVDGDPNDSLTLPGEYVGGGLLAVDALVGPDGGSDQLILQGIVSGDPTAVSVNIIDITGPSSEGISVVTLENGTPGDQFFLAGGPIDAGLFQLDLFGGSDGFRLVTVPDAANIGSPMATLPVLVALTHEVSGRIDRNNEILDGEGEEALLGDDAVPAVAQVHAGSWAKIVGSSVKQDTKTSFTLADTPMRQSDRFDLGLVGIIGGLDIAQSGVRDGTRYAWLVGALGGYVWADVDFATATGTQDIESAVFGGYGGLAYGPFRMHLLGKMDFGDVTFNEPDLAPGLAAKDTAGFRTVSVEGNLGYKIPLPNSMYVQPIASLYYSNTQLDDVNIGGTTVEFETLDSLRARAGVRFGANIVGEKYVLDPWVQASIWHELLDSDTRVTLASGGTSLDLIGAGVETYGEVGAGVNVVRIGPGLSGQVRADAKFGDLDLLALSGQVGIEYRFPVD